MREKPPAVTMNSTQPNPGSLEDKYMKLLAEALNGLGYVHRKKLKRKAGKWYQVSVIFQWPKNGQLHIETLRVRETRAPDG
jgi:hypothetical protein